MVHRLAKHITQRDRDWLVVVPLEHKLQVAAVRNFFAKLSESVCGRLDYLSAHVGNQDRYLTPHTVGMTQIQQLSGDYDALAP